MDCRVDTRTIGLDTWDFSRMNWQILVQCSFGWLCDQWMYWISGLVGGQIAGDGWMDDF